MNPIRRHFGGHLSELHGTSMESLITLEVGEQRVVLLLVRNWHTCDHCRSKPVTRKLIEFTHGSPFWLSRASHDSVNLVSGRSRALDTSDFSTVGNAPRRPESLYLAASERFGIMGECLLIFGGRLPPLTPTTGAWMGTFLRLRPRWYGQMLGDNGSSQLGDGTTTNRPLPVAVYGVSNAVQVSSRTRHSCALLTNGTLTCWGEDIHGQLGNGNNQPISLPVGVRQISSAIQAGSGETNSCALLTGGTVKCWGGDSNRDRVSELSLGGDFACLRTTNGNVGCWGDGNQGQPFDTRSNTWFLAQT